METEDRRTFDDALIEDLEPTEEEQARIVGGAKKKGDEEEPPVQA